MIACGSNSMFLIYQPFSHSVYSLKKHEESRRTRLQRLSQQQTGTNSSIIKYLSAKVTKGHLRVSVFLRATLESCGASQKSQTLTP